MKNEMRAAQFAPFAALTGFEELLEESRRLTDERPALSDDEAFKLDQALRRLAESRERHFVELVYFEPDPFKDGGECKTKSGVVRRIDEVMRVVIFEDREVISIDDLVEITNIA